LALAIALPAVVQAQPTQDLDYGDAPDSQPVPGYPTLLVNNGARHMVQGNNMLLGTLRDIEIDGQPVPPGLGDDVLPSGGMDDEDGVIFHTALIAGVPNTITVITTLGGTLQGWLDLNVDSDWADPGEQIISNLPVNPGGNSVTYQVGALAGVGPTYARFRLSGQLGLGFAGLAPDGEVEDYEIQLDAIKWLQPPDLTTNGVDVDNTVELADDFLCNLTGPITDIHIWGSFRNDEELEGLPDLVLTNLVFALRIFSDVPAGIGNPYSHPGTQLWTTNFVPGSYRAGLCSRVAQGEWWHSPQVQPTPPGFWLPQGDFNCYQFDFYPQEPFWQTNGTIYWLAVKVLNAPQDWQFGWKSTPLTNRWNDDAVWLDPAGGAMPWRELRYLGEHPYHILISNSLDLAFALSTEQLPYDFGDAPDAVQGTSPGDYQTILADNGAYHAIVAGAPYFDDGTQTDQPDAEADGQPTANADGDDLNGAKPDDEDGILIPLLIAGQAGTVTITVDDGAGGLGAGGGFVDAWIDFNADGDWTDPGEQICSGWLVQGANPVGFAVPAGAAPGQTFARFRINSTAAGLLPTGGPAQDGEVEDHPVIIEQEPQQLDFGDAPDTPGAAGYQTLLANNGARHPLTGPVLGNARDGELDGQPTPNADGDDLNVDDEDGVAFPTALLTGVPGSVQVSSVSGGVLQAWFDWSNDGDWADASEYVINNVAIPAGTTTLNFPVPTFATNQTVYARFRISSQGGLGYAGLASDGEVEDYLIPFEELKWLQVPEQGEEGVDVDNTDFTLADDFVCTASGPITDIHIWGSFVNDQLPPEGPGGLIFTVSIWSDVPAGVDASYSHPGQLLWSRTFSPGGYNAGKIWSVSPGEWWHYPVPATWIPAADQNIYQFDFYPHTNQFIQVEGTVYWLAVKYSYPAISSFEFGWKTTPAAWNDDACYYDPANSPIFWKDMVYPPQHQWASESLNLSFALSGVEQEVRDWGDAPDPPYPTLAASAGANHVIVTNFMLGTVIDAEVDGQPTALANGDDVNLVPDDEDGVTFPNPLIRGSNVAVNVFLTSGLGVGALDAWVDFDGNGVWANLLPEKVFNAQPLVVGNNALAMAIPANAALGTNYARFRLTSAGVALPTGPALNGEVEDYQVLIYQRKLATNLVIQSIVVTNLGTQQVVKLQWNAEAGISYQVQEATTLTNSPLVWSNVPPEVLGPANTLVFTNAQFFERYYRVWVPYVCP
jgi:hypothetical protein